MRICRHLPSSRNPMSARRIEDVQDISSFFPYKPNDMIRTHVQRSQQLLQGRRGRDPADGSLQRAGLAVDLGKSTDQLAGAIYDEPGAWSPRLAALTTTPGHGRPARPDQALSAGCPAVGAKSGSNGSSVLVVCGSSVIGVCPTPAAAGRERRARRGSRRPKRSATAGHRCRRSPALARPSAVSRSIRLRCAK